jgi:hypothetical protein
MQRKATRRELIAGAAGVTAVASLSAGAAPAAALPVAGSEAQALSEALGLERLGVIAYRQVLASGVVNSGVRAQLRVLESQERQHVAKLEQVLRQLGAAVPQGPSGVAAAQAVLAQHQVHRSLTVLPTQHDCLRLLIDVESLTEGGHFKAIAALQHPALIQLSVALMGSDAQHWAVLSSLQHNGDVMQAVPYPFVQGSP